MRKTLFIVLLLILCSILVTFPNVEIVKAQSTIYIRADGSVEGTDSLFQNGNVYVFTEDINGSVVVERDNVVVDGAGFVLQGAGPWNFVCLNISSRTNVTIKNMRIEYGGVDAIHIFNSSNYAISDNNIIFPILDYYYQPRINLNNSSNNVLSGNNGQISFVESDGNILFSNSLGISLSKSLNNTITGNKNRIELTESSNNFISENNSTIELDTQSNGNIISENIGFIGLWGSSNNSIIGNNGKILIFESHTNTIIQNTVENNRPY